MSQVIRAETVPSHWLFKVLCCNKICSMNYLFVLNLDIRMLLVQRFNPHFSPEFVTRPRSLAILQKPTINSAEREPSKAGCDALSLQDWVREHPKIQATTGLRTRSVLDSTLSVRKPRTPGDSIGYAVAVENW